MQRAWRLNIVSVKGKFCKGRGIWAKSKWRNKRQLIIVVYLIREEKPFDKKKQRM